MNSKTLVAVMTCLGAAASLVGGVQAAATEPVATCTYKPAKGLVGISVTGVEVDVLLAKASDDRLLVDADLCLSPKGRPASMTTIDTVVVRGGPNDQSVGIDLSDGAFAPGRTDEHGPSDEIELDIALGSGLDSVWLASDVAGLNVYAGTRRGVHRLNLNGGEADGVDADVTVRGIEQVTVLGGPANDRFIASGGQRTGKALALRASVEDRVGGNDLFVGGRGDDDLVDVGDQADSDTLRGSGGDDFLYSVDFDTAGDLIDAGRGVDLCTVDAVDVVLRCDEAPTS